MIYFIRSVFIWLFSSTLPFPPCSPYLPPPKKNKAYQYPSEQTIRSQYARDFTSDVFFLL